MSSLVKAPEPERTNVARVNITAAPEIPVLAGDAGGMAFFRMIGQRRWLILLLVFAFTATAVPIVLSVPKLYRAQARVLIHVPAAKELALGTQRGSDSPDINIEVERMRDRANAIAVVEALGLKSKPEFNPDLQKPSTFSSLIEGAKSALFGKSGQKAAPSTMDRLLAKFDERLTVRREGTSSVVSIGFTSSDPSLSAAVPNAVIQTFLKRRNSRWQSNVAIARDWLRSRIAAQRDRLAEAKAQLAEFESRNGTAAVGAGLNAQDELKVLLQRQGTIQSERYELKSQIAAIDTSLKSDAAPSAGEPVDISALRSQLRSQQLASEELNRTFGGNYAAVIDARTKIVDIKSTIRTAVEAWQASLRERELVLAHEANDVGSQIERIQASIPSTTAAGTLGESLTASVANETLALRQLEHQLSNLDAEAALPALTAEVLSPATIPTMPLGRSRKLLLLFAAVAASFAAITIAALVHLFDRSLRSPEQLRTGTSPLLPFAGFLPAVGKRRANHLTDLVLREPDPNFVARLDAIRQTISRLQEGKSIESLAVTAAEVGAGASFVARALALEITGWGQRVLLVDLSDSSPVPSNSDTETSSATGNTELLKGGPRFDRMIRHDADSGLNFLGLDERLRPMIWSRDQIDRIITCAANRDMVVIFDCLPVLASSATLAAVSQCDATLLVARWGHTARSLVGRSASRLERAKPGTAPALVINAAEAAAQTLPPPEDIDSSLVPFLSRE